MEICKVLLDGRQMPIDDVQKGKLDALVIGNVNPKGVLDLCLAEGQITEMSQTGLFIESREPKDAALYGKAMTQYRVIINEKHRYLIAQSEEMAETFALPGLIEKSISEIVLGSEKN